MLGPHLPAPPRSSPHLSVPMFMWFPISSTILSSKAKSSLAWMALTGSVSSETSSLTCEEASITWVGGWLTEGPRSGDRGVGQALA